ncbi:hypothetical protein H4R99_005443 [Coemansia sp. RSA 1722]|nr:hypothetical protein H4R99_005443 [Coemansia sp. RSA 1722]
MSTVSKRTAMVIAALGLLLVPGVSTTALQMNDKTGFKSGHFAVSKRFDLLGLIRDMFGGRTSGSANGANGRTEAASNRETGITLSANHPGIDREKIDLYAAYAGAAYLIDSDDWDCGVQCSRPGTEGTVIKYRWSIPVVTSDGFIALNPNKKIIIVSFRGSAEFGDWVEDFTTSFADWPKSGAGAQVGMGFLGGYQVASPLILRTIIELSINYPDYMIVATGHSLGGARASMFAADISANYPHLLARLELYTYGQPKCGDKGFADYMDSLDFQKIREVNKADIAPHLPSADWGYYHFGTEVWVSVEDQYLVCQRSNYSMCSESIPAFSYMLSGFVACNESASKISHRTPRSHALSKRKTLLGSVFALLGIGNGGWLDINMNAVLSGKEKFTIDDVAQMLGLPKMNLNLYAAYSGATLNITSNQWNCGAQCNRKETKGTEVIYHWDGTSVATNGYIAINRYRQEILVVYRGSVVIGDWIEDFTANLVDFPESVPGSQVSKGFLEGYQAANPRVMDTVLELANRYPEYKIIATGHSLGGARASLFVADIAANHPELISRIEMYTYGKPRCGNVVYAQYMDSLGIPYVRQIYKGDLYPHLPIKQLGYVHFGAEVWIPQDDEYVICQSGDYSRCSERLPLARLNTEEHYQYYWLH